RALAPDRRGRQARPPHGVGGVAGSGSADAARGCLYRPRRRQARFRRLLLHRAERFRPGPRRGRGQEARAHHRGRDSLRYQHSVWSGRSEHSVRDGRFRAMETSLSRGGLSLDTLSAPRIEATLRHGVITTIDKALLDAAWETVRPVVRWTPMLRSDHVDSLVGARVFLKAESLQP